MLAPSLAQQRCYVNGVTTTVVGPDLLSVFDAAAGTWSATGQSSVLLHLQPGGGALARIEK
ncbi:MAG: hypothetical protein HY646_04905 [Acidobacteria bacterium]|nr:hypothetical protein [Acidobacteriota bacterium]